MFCKNFLFVCGLFFHSLNSVFYTAEEQKLFFFFLSRTFLTLVETNISVFLSEIVLFILYLKIHHQAQYHVDFIPCFFWKFYSFAFYI